MPRAADRIANHLGVSRIQPSPLDYYGSRIGLHRPSRCNISITGRKRPSKAYSEIVPEVISMPSSTIASVEETNTDEPVILTIIENANVDGVRHLQANNPVTKYCWAAIITIFLLLAMFQIWNQISMYITTPVATNIEAYYPEKIMFPVVAICNNNQFRLTFLTGASIQNRIPKTTRNNDTFYENMTVFDKVLENVWDMDAVKFLRNAAHWKSRMILSCTWPNGTRCRLSQFKAVWTVSGLCWAINTDPLDPYYVTASGSGHGLKLLLNVERYERIESCTSHFTSSSLPGLKVLIYNQSEVPVSSLHGVNVPPGYSVDIPYRMQIRKKYGSGCIEEEREMKARSLPFEEPNNYRTCSMRLYLREVEERCFCSMRRAFEIITNRMEDLPYCNVQQYFDCVLPLTRTEQERFSSKYRCAELCNQVDFIAWQDISLLPNNIFPSINDSDEEDTTDVTTDYDDDNDDEDDLGRDENFHCIDNQLLTPEQIRRIKHAAETALEKQSRHQSNNKQRTQRLIARFLDKIQKLINAGWGWNNETYENVYHRLNKTVRCFANMAVSHTDIFTALKSPVKDDVRTAEILSLLEPNRHIELSKYFNTTTRLREVYGERYDEVVQSMQKLGAIIERLCKIYDRSSYKSALGGSLKRMDTIVALIRQYEGGRIQKRIWAEKMQSRNMRHFIDQEFYEEWYNVINQNLDDNLLRKIIEMEDDDLLDLQNLIENSNGLKMGAAMYFGDDDLEHQQKFYAFINDITECTFINVKNETATLLQSFRRTMHDFQSACTDLYKKELPSYLANFEYGATFVEQNFAMINVFLHKMNVEVWKQDSTYSIWSLACDVGGALGLFLGASLLTLIELIYLCFEYGICSAKCSRMEKIWEVKKMAQKQMRKLKSKIDVKVDVSSKKHSSSLPTVLIVENSPEFENPEAIPKFTKGRQLEAIQYDDEPMEWHPLIDYSESVNLPDETVALQNANLRKDSDSSSFLINKAISRSSDNEEDFQCKPNHSTDTLKLKNESYPRSSMQSSTSSSDTGRPLLFKPTSDRQTFV